MTLSLSASMMLDAAATTHTVTTTSATATALAITNSSGVHMSADVHITSDSHASPAAAPVPPAVCTMSAATTMLAAPTPAPPSLAAPTKVRARSSYLTHEQKRLLCIYAKQHPTVTQTQLAQWARERFHLQTLPSQSSISHTLKRKHNYEHMMSDELACKRTRNVKFPELDTALANWYLYCQARQIKVQGDEVKTKAHLFFEMMGIHTADPPPQFSNGWLHSFQSRHGFSRSAGSNAMTATIGRTADTAPLVTTKSELLAAIHGVAPWDLYWMDETSLFYAMSPECDDSAIAPTGPTKRMTLALCTNADGSDILDPFFVCDGPLLNTVGVPRGFQYAYNRRTWFTPTVFREWLLALDWKMHEESRTIVLLLDAYASHYTRKLVLKNVSLRFVPQTGGLQSDASAATLLTETSSSAAELFASMAHTVVTALKRRYRHTFLDHVLDRRDAREVEIYDVEPLDAIQWVIQSWRELPRALIAESFAKIGVAVATDAPASEVVQTEERLDAQLLALLKRLKLKAPMPLAAFLAPAAEDVRDEALVYQDFVDSAVNASLSVKVVGTEVESPRRLIRSRVHDDSAPQLSSTESALDQSHASGAASAAVTALADDEWHAWTATQRTKSMSDVDALQRVIQLATEMHCEPSTLLDLNRMLLEVQTQAHALADASQDHAKDESAPATSAGAAVCRFTFGSTPTKHVV